MFNPAYKVQIIDETGKVVSESTVKDLTEKATMKWYNKAFQKFFAWTPEEETNKALAEAKALIAAHEAKEKASQPKKS